MKVFVWEHRYGAKSVYVAESLEEIRRAIRERPYTTWQDKEKNPWGYAIMHDPPSYTTSLPCHMSICDGSVYNGL